MDPLKVLHLIGPKASVSGRQRKVGILDALELWRSDWNK